MQCIEDFLHVNEQWSSRCGTSIFFNSPRRRRGPKRDYSCGTITGVHGIAALIAIEILLLFAVIHGIRQVPRWPWFVGIGISVALTLLAKVFPNSWFLLMFPASSLLAFFAIDDYKSAVELHAYLINAPILSLLFGLWSRKCNRVESIFRLIVLGLVLLSLFDVFVTLVHSVTST